MLNAKLYFSNIKVDTQRHYLKLCQKSEVVRIYFGLEILRQASVESFISTFEDGDFYRLEKKENNKWLIFSLNNKKYVQIKMLDAYTISFDLKKENEITDLSEAEFELDLEKNSLKLSGGVDINLFCEII